MFKRGKLNLWFHFALVAGALNGMFALPMKLNKNWARENNFISP